MRGLNQEFRSDYIVPAGVDYNNIEAKFQLSFKTKVLQGVLGAWFGLYSKVPLANL
jgi:outer membrane phospholipase A